MRVSAWVRCVLEPEVQRGLVWMTTQCAQTWLQDRLWRAVVATTALQAPPQAPLKTGLAHLVENQGQHFKLELQVLHHPGNDA